MGTGKECVWRRGHGYKLSGKKKEKRREVLEVVEEMGKYPASGKLKGHKNSTVNMENNAVKGYRESKGINL